MGMPISMETIADQLAKEAAQETKGAEDLQAVASFGDMKLAAKEQDFS